ncbi:MAG: DUF4139 domain-containing protein [Planctomycetota bacterium]|jgi:hypothetical protein
MNRHLTEKELIEYQFKLASEDRAEEIAGHLRTCAQCRRQREQLKRRFAALDLLREETKVSDKLISTTIEQAKRGTKSKILLFRTSGWISAAAAVLLIGLMLLVSDFGRDKKQGRQIEEDMSLAKEEVKLDRPLEVALDSSLSEKELVAKKPRTVAEVVGGVAAELAKAQVPEKPPFAPASAIELVTLPRRDNVQITIYNSADLTLVRERRNLTLKKGWNWLQFMWANTLIDPTSLSLEPMENADKIDIQQLVFPARLKDIGRWLIRSETEGQVSFEVTYFTSGLSWRAFYMGTLDADERKMKLQGYVRVANRSGEDYENAQTRLIVGKVHQLDKIAQLAKRQYPYNRPGELRLDFDSTEVSDVEKEGEKVILNASEPIVGGLFRTLKPKEIKKEGLSEYFLYTIEGTETIPDKWGKRLLSFDVDDIDVNSLYKYDEQRWGKQTIRFVTFTNDQEHNLGDTPIPNGNVRIYSQADADGQLSYVGQTNVKYIPVDEEVELNLGSARLVLVEPTLIDFKTSNFLFDTKGNIAGWDETRKWKIEITNTRNLPVEIEITRGFGTAYWSLEYDGKVVSYEKHDAIHARFKTKLQPQSKRTFTYTVTTYHGRREESVTK